MKSKTFAAADGRFSFVFSTPVRSGFYRVWAKNLANDGTESGPSEVVTTAVIRPLRLWIGTIVLDYASVIITLLALLLLLLVLIALIWLRVRRWQRDRRDIEISEAEQALHHGFDKMREDMGLFLTSLLSTKSSEELTKREEELSPHLAKDMENIEQDIEKEVEDIRKVK